jgi:hypothetical protein
MRAFALPLSISRRIYEVFEYLSCDHIPFSKTVAGVQRSFSIRGYTVSVLAQLDIGDMLLNTFLRLITS